VAQSIVLVLAQSIVLVLARSIVLVLVHTAPPGAHRLAHAPLSCDLDPKMLYQFGSGVTK
jgi:hypothetical protein